MTTRRDFLLGSASLAATTRVRAQQRARPPSFLFIVADDLGAADLGCYGRTDVATPNLDALAAGGMRFTDAYANACVCSPTRVALLTGRYQHRLAVGLEEPLGAGTGLDPSHPGLASLLKARGYQTSLVGKWHLGTQLQFSPLKHGYDRFWGCRGGGIDYFSHDVRDPKGVSRPDLWEGDEPVTASGYMTELLATRASQEIQRMARNDAPFLLSLHLTAPHWPWEGPADAALPAGAPLTHYDGGSMETYRAMLAAMDLGIGRVLKALDDTGRRSDTLIVFTSDNGGERYSKNWPFSGMKSELLEGGIRTPLIASWPGRIPRGSTSGQVAVSMDWVPTLLQAAGGQTHPEYPSDGISLLSALGGGPAAPRRLFWRFKAHQQAALRDGNWKYLRIEGTEYLFDVVADPQERANRRVPEAARFAAMKSAWEGWNATMLPYTPTSASFSNKSGKAIVDRY